jgi:hypothetical protein
LSGRPVSVIVLAADVRPFLVRELARLSANREHALSALGRRVSSISGEKCDSTCKRIRFVLRGWRPTLRAHDADCLLLALSPPRFLELEPSVPHFPGSKLAALQMVRDHEAATGLRLEDKGERDRLAHQLYKFSQGFLNAVQEDPGVLAEAA